MSITDTSFENRGGVFWELTKNKLNAEFLGTLSLQRLDRQERRFRANSSRLDDLLQCGSTKFESTMKNDTMITDREMKEIVGTALPQIGEGGERLSNATAIGILQRP